MISTNPIISKSSSPFTNTKRIGPSAPITISITVTFIFYSLFFFFSFQPSLGTYISFHFLFILLCWLPGRQNLLFGRFSFFVDYQLLN